MQLSQVKVVPKNLKRLKIKSKFVVLMMGVSVSMIAFLTGYSVVCLSQLEILIRKKNKLSDFQSDLSLSLSTSAFLMGALLGPFFYKRFQDKYGERKGMIILDIGSILCIILQLINLSFWFLFIPRLLLGIFVGISTAILPVYLNSISPSSMSGRMGCLNQILTSFGVLSAYTYGFLIDDDINDEFMWRITLAIPITILLYHIFALLWIFPFDSLERHINRGEVEKIEEYCDFVYLNATFDDIRQLRNVSRKVKPKMTYQLSSFTNMRMIIALLVIASNQMAGTSGIFLYSKQIFNTFTNSSQDSQNLMLYLGLFQFIGCLLSGFIVDKYGRKQIFSNGQFSLIIVLCLVFLCNRFKMITSNDIFNDLSIILVFVHVIIFSLTLGPICIIYCAELVEDITPVVFLLQLLTTIISLSSNFVIKHFGVSIMFMGFGIVSLLFYIFLHINMKQTKGVTKKQIDHLYGEKNIQADYIEIVLEDENEQGTQYYNLLGINQSDEVKLKTSSNINLLDQIQKLF